MTGPRPVSHIDCRAILFDNDGVLVDSHDETLVAWTQLAEEFGLDIDVLAGELAGVRAVDTLRRHVPARDLERVVARLEDLEVELATATQAMPGAIELLASLPDGHWTIVTSATRRLAEARWRGAGIRMPERGVTAELVTNGKPDPEPFLEGARMLGVSAAACVVFEDSPSGGASGAAAGATVIAVGDQPWAGAAAFRVPDLTSIRVDTTGSGLIVTIR